MINKLTAVKEKEFMKAMSVQIEKNMKNLFLILISVFMFSAASAQTTKTCYTCVMHSEIRQDKPGKCPKCGMTLVKKTIKVNAPKPAPEIKQEKPKPQQTQPVQKDQSKTADTVSVKSQKPEIQQQQTKVVYTCAPGSADG